MKNPLAVFTGAALATLAALAGLNMTTWPGGPPDTQKPAEAAVKAQDPATQETSAAKAPEPAPAEEAGKTPEKSTEMAAIPAPEPKPAPEAKPELDTVRVESDGQAIVAGRAEPGAEIALKLGDRVIGKGLANTDGSWVVVPDQPLPKGAHEIVIEQKTPDSGPVVAGQSIAVAVPEKPGQQAMVALTEPGTATKVLQAGGNQEQASLSEMAQSSAEQPKEAETAQKSAEPAEAQEPAATAEKPVASGEPAGQAAEPAPETTVAKIEVPDPVAPPAETPPPPQAAQATPDQNIPLGLAAVDYNDKGDIIFSGRAKPGTAVRLYVDNRAVGDAMVDAQGNWSFAGKDIIAPGTHDLRVDQIDKAGKVLARVELPFLRENAEAVAALNTPSESEKPEADPPQASTPEPQSEPPAQKTAEQPAPASEPPAQTAEARPQATTAEPAQQEPVEPQTKAAAEQPPEPSAPAPAKTVEAESQPTGQVQKSEPKASSPSSDQPAATADEVTTTAAAVQAAKGVDPDKPRSGKVVIQPGNNLWKLSRIIYGRGINFTVIYQANKDQIRNPNRIYPGQIFAIPGAMPPESIDPKRKDPLTSAEGGAAQ